MIQALPQTQKILKIGCLISTHYRIFRFQNHKVVLLHQHSPINLSRQLRYFVKLQPRQRHYGYPSLLRMYCFSLWVGQLFAKIMQQLILPFVFNQYRLTKFFKQLFGVLNNISLFNQCLLVNTLIFTLKKLSEAFVLIASFIKGA